MENTHSGRTVSLWMATQAVSSFKPLRENATADVCIVGAGIAGLSTAYLLAREGHSVIVIDDGPIISGETERTTAHLVSALDDRFFELERMFGEDGARLAAQSHSAAIDRIESIIAAEKIPCDFMRLDGYLFVPPGESTDILDRELDAARRAGLSVELVKRSPARTFDTGIALRFSNQAQFHPLKYLQGVAAAIERRGGGIFAYTHATKIEDGESPCVKTGDGHLITAQAIVVATNTPVNDRVTMHTKQAPYRTYVIGARVPAGSVARALYWDTANPYHYIRLQTVREQASGREHEVLIVGGEDHKTGQAEHPEERFARLEDWTRDRFHIEGIEYRWSGQVMEPVDSLAFIGRNPGDDNVFIATGDSGNGMTHGTIAGMLLTDLIMGRENPWAKLYDPSRKPTHSLAKFAQENFNVAKQYADYLTGGDVPKEAHLAPDSGAVIRRRGKKVAVYCDDGGHHHEFSAVCPHLGCIVSWNSVEKTWDCPCHGSRFGPHGNVVNGPANADLENVESTEKPKPVETT
jgi:glycine/D-amino acid oxidase-like deaminating enzyme/nitrite reductase/ring-hydroxylating ferredoxin subunit